MSINSDDVVSGEVFLAKAKRAFGERSKQEPPPLFEKFVEEFFYLYPLEDLIGRRWSDLLGSVYQWWLYIQRCPRGHAKVKVFNPSLEEHGWLTGHTVVVVLQRDMPFLVDSVRMEITRRNIAIHSIKSTVLHLERDEQHQLVAITGRESAEGEKEALLVMEINRHTDEGQLEDISASLHRVLSEVEAAVDAYPAMLEDNRSALGNLRQAQGYDPAVVQASQDFLAWLMDGHYTYLAYREYDLLESEGQRVLEENVSRRRGISVLGKKEAQSMLLNTQSPGTIAFYESPELISFSKASARASVHRYAHPDYVIVKRFDERGSLCGEARFKGLFTSQIYHQSPMSIPMIRDKLQQVIDQAGWDSISHDGKTLREVLETYPRDELFQASAEQLTTAAIKIAQINERYRVRLFMRRDSYGRFVTALVYVPRDLFTTAIRLKIQDIIATAIGASEIEFTTYFSESILARVYLVFKIERQHQQDFDVAKLEQKIIEVLRSWDEQLSESLIENLGEEVGSSYFNLFKNSFSSSYREFYEPRTAVHDIQTFIRLQSSTELGLSFYQPIGSADGCVRFKIFTLDRAPELSDVIPILENLGLRVIGAHPFKIKRLMDGADRIIFLHDFELQYNLANQVDFHAARNQFQEAFAAVWSEEAENDEFNRLVLGARLDWRGAAVLRAYAVYLKQTQFNFSQSSIANTLAQQLEITRNLVALFKATFDPRMSQGREKNQERIERLNKKILQALKQVSNLNEDMIIRRYLDLINGTLRTNFFQHDADGNPKSYISFKLSPRDIPGIPEPRPLYEIFVYSPRTEGVHLRGGKVARGGLRWSDRLEDYRTEVLGLVKAQQVKNAVIVPDGAKGGFVAKGLHTGMDRDQRQAEAIECYKIFIRGLLDLTDNLVNNQIQVREGIVRRDDDDPYLVVAADKGTASFSDIANQISAEYEHWLGDAFASGGSQGYDHKKMGITARGAWISVQRHFREQGVDVQSQDVTVIGIGDMSGDVFGNGMLRSRHIRLLAAFDHRHIFVDPAPDPATSFAERERLFNLPRSSWPDYSSELISEGGGVFPRDAKSIVISPEMQATFDIQADALTPTALIQALLRAPVDLIWNGGIGTYVKSSRESNAEVGDKANDALRVNGSELRCRVIGEGGNLGMTQLGRIEYALAGGACNTDFIDNSAGVDSSDHEVNIKILLNDLVQNSDLTEKQRNQLLAEMTEDVARLVLTNNYLQAQTLSLIHSQAQPRMDEYRRLIQRLESDGRLDRELEFLPDDEALRERQAKGLPLTRPELAVLMSYVKAMLKEALATEELATDPYLATALERPFPPVLLERYPEVLQNHRLRKEIIATQLANDIVNHMGITYCHRLMESTGASLPQIAKAYVAARDIYGLHSFREAVEALDSRIPAELQLDLLHEMARKVRRASRWLLRNRRGKLEPAAEVAQFVPLMEKIGSSLPDSLRGTAREEWDHGFNRLKAQGVPDQVAMAAAIPSSLYSGLGMVEAARQSGTDVLEAAEVFFLLGDHINLHWFANQITAAKVESHWQAKAREAYLDDLESQLRRISVSILGDVAKGASVEAAIEQWSQEHEGLIVRWRVMLNELQASSTTDFAMFSIAVRELLDLAQASRHVRAA